MTDFDVVIAGAGPAGLAAGLRLARAARRVVVLERESFGGALPKIDRIDDYPGVSEAISGAELSAALVEQTHRAGLEIRLAEVSDLEVFSSSQWVACADGTGFTTRLVIAATGLRPKPLGVPGEVELRGRGVMDCPVCDGGFFRERIVAVYGSGDAAISEALCLSRAASRVYLLAPGRGLRSTAAWAERVHLAANVETRFGVTIEAILGDSQVEALRLRSSDSESAESLAIDGFIARAEFEPNTDWLRGLGAVQEHGYLSASETMQTQRPSVLVAGDIRVGSGRTVASAVGDGTNAGQRAIQLLEALDGAA